MAVSRAKKHQSVATLAAELQNSTSAIVGTFSGLTADRDSSLRSAIRKAGGSYHVVKNKLAPKAAAGTKVEGALANLKGVSSVAYTSGDPVALAKALSEWVKDNTEFFSFKRGIVDGKVISAAEVEALSKLPGKEELFSKLLFLMNAPATRLAVVTNAVSRNLAVVVDQAVKENKLSGGAGTPAPAAAAPAVEEAPAAEAAAPADTEGASAQAEAATTEAPAEGAAEAAPEA